MLSPLARLAFHTSLGLTGLWIGQCGALALVGLGEYALVFFTNWDAEIARAERRMEQEEGEIAAGAGGERRGRTAH